MNEGKIRNINIKSLAPGLVLATRLFYEMATKIEITKEGVFRVSTKKEFDLKIPMKLQDT